MIGLRAALERIKQRSVDFFLSHFSSASSVSDSQDFRQFCRSVAEDPTALSSFRQNSKLRSIMEHVTHNYAQVMIDSALQRHPSYKNLMPAFLKNDLVGRPILETFDAIGAASPTTLRYIKILADIEDMFGALDGYHVAEIGGGYGGQAAIIQARFRVASYTIIDLPEAGAMAARFLAELGRAVTIRNPDDPKPENSPDLVVSNYAISEIPEHLQMIYLRDVVRKSPRGYVLYNDVAVSEVLRKRTGRSPLNAEHFADQIPGARIERGAPFILDDDADRSNVLIWWNRTKLK